MTALIAFTKAWTGWKEVVMSKKINDFGGSS